ncbi:MAG: hypothetical protein OXL36_14920 [Bryobacterales bacterium]|nr:hypothetical protein [Bryobacterales bacterium]MDE0295859.1 hypothetical protein [Bryobacterales bacterium]
MQKVVDLRDWFAGQALNAMPLGDRIVNLRPNEAAILAYRYADAMLAIRKMRSEIVGVAPESGSGEVETVETKELFQGMMD